MSHPYASRHVAAIRDPASLATRKADGERRAALFGDIRKRVGA